MFRQKKKIRRIFILAASTTLCYTMIEMIQLHPLRYNDACALPVSWHQGPLRADAVSNMADWSFQNIIMCPEFSLRILPLERKTISLQCDGDSTRVISRTTSSSADIFTIPFRDKCLINFIDSCCLNGRPVPNVVHYVWYSNSSMDFFHFLSFISAVKFVKPCLILIHGPFRPHGAYWDYFVHVFPNTIHVIRNHTTTVGDNKLAYPEHGSDVMRIEALDVYGGLYLDWDEVILRSVDSLRDYPMTMGLETERKMMGSQFIMARKGTPFLHLWLHSYEINYRTDWTYNALEVPFNIAKQLPDTIHVESNRFTRPNGFQADLIYENNFDWSDNYAMHLFSRWYRSPISMYSSKFRFDENSIGLLNITLGSVARHILFGNKELCINNRV